MTQIYHAHLYGTRDSKYDWLQNHDVLSTNWQQIKPQAPFYLLVPQNTDLLGEYNQGWKITDVMPTYSLGCLTKRDNLVIGHTRRELKEKISSFMDSSKSDELATKEFGLKLKDQDMWDAHKARNSISQTDADRYIRTESFRPFERRFIFYHEKFIARLNTRVMQHLAYKNLALVCTRQLASLPFDHIWVTDSLTDQHIISVRTKEGGVVSPLYLYPVGETTPLEYRTEFTQERRPNFSPEFLKDLTAKLGTTPTPETIFYYIYAVFHSPTYRIRYAEFLNIDFPRVPLTDDPELFHQLASYGEELVALHLMKSPRLDFLITHYGSDSNPVVDAGHPKYLGGKVTINGKGDGFVGVPEEVWNFYVGSYQVCQKWLKDRKGRTLSPEDITHYQRIVVALQETIRLMQQIDEAIAEFPIT